MFENIPDEVWRWLVILLKVVVGVTLVQALIVFSAFVEMVRRQ